MTASHPTLLLLLLLLAGTPGWAKSTLVFRAAPEPNASAAVLAGDGVVLRVRGVSDAAARDWVQQVAERLNALAEEGVGPDDLAARPVDPGIALYARDRLVATAAHSLARLAGTTAERLAEEWLAALRRAFAGPYLSAPSPVAVALDQPSVVRVTGQPAGAALTLEPPPAGLEATLDADGRLNLVARRPGRYELTLRRGAVSLALRVDVRPPAGALPEAAVATVTGEQPPLDYVRDAVQSALSAASTVAPGAVMTFELPANAPLPRPDAAAVLTVPVSLAGRDYASVGRSVRVTLRSRRLPDRPAARLFVSNKPESVPATRLLLRAQLPPGERDRLLYHHKTVTEGPLIHQLRLLNRGARTAEVWVADSHAGPTDDELHAGHVAVRAYWQQRLAGQGRVLVIPPDRGWVLLSRTTPAAAVISGLAEFETLAGEGVELELLAFLDTVGPAPLPLPLTGPYSDEATYADPQVAVTLEPAGAATPPFALGAEPVTSLTGAPLAGRYGVVHTLSWPLANPGERARRFDLIVTPRGGVARVTLVVDGRLVESDLLQAGQSQAVAEIDVPPGAQRTVPVLVMPESGSYYPVHVALVPQTERP